MPKQQVPLTGKVTTWLSSPIIIPRWTLSLMYLVLTLSAVSITLFPTSSIDSQVSIPGRITLSVLMAAGALVALVGSFRLRWEPLERWGAFVVGLCVAFYGVIVVLGGHAGSLLIIILALAVPIGRSISLLRRTGLHA